MLFANFILLYSDNIDTRVRINVDVTLFYIMISSEYIQYLFKLELVWLQVVVFFVWKNKVCLTNLIRNPMQSP